MKICRTCNISKIDQDFRIYKNRGKTYIKHECRECEYSRKKSYDYKEQSKYYKAKERYGLTKEEYDELMKATNCRICKCPFKDSTPHIDHNHETGKIRGVLCGSCNKGLGLFKDNPVILSSAIKYLLIEGSTTRE